MFDNKGNKFLEKNYEGYGVFGNKDYYELLDQMNGGTGDRSRGINLAFGKEPDYSGEVLHPALVVNPNFNVLALLSTPPSVANCGLLGL